MTRALKRDIETKVAAVLAFIIVFLGGCAAPKADLTRFEFTRLEMGVKARVVTYAPTRDQAEAGAQAAFARIAALDAAMSDYRPDSELSRLCAHKPGEPVPISRDLLVVLLTGQTVSEASNGAFDVTVGPLVMLWRESRKSGKLPDHEKLAAAMHSVGWRKLALDARASTATLTVPNMKLDLGGIAKGYAAEQAAEVLRGMGLDRSLVALAGDIRVGNAPPGEDGWRIDLAPPSPHVPPRTLIIKNASISTSGDSEQFVEIAGTRYSHIVDPRTGLGATHSAQATAVGVRGDVVDAAATAASLLGVLDGPDVGSQLGVSTILTGARGTLTVEWVSDDAKLLNWAK